jgi:hypothetical protein
MSIRTVLKSLTARNEQETYLLQTLVGLAVSVGGRASDLAVAAALEWERASKTLPQAYSFPEVFNSVPEDVKNEFYRLVEAVQVFGSIHGPIALENSLQSQQPPSWLGELRRIRDLCQAAGFRAAF